MHIQELTAHSHQQEKKRRSQIPQVREICKLVKYNMCRVTCVNKLFKIIFDFTAQSSSELTLSMGDGSVNCMALHKHGLYTAGEDGVLRHLEVTADRVRVKHAYPVGVPISSLAFNGLHNRLGLGSYKVKIFP